MRRDLKYKMIIHLFATYTYQYFSNVKIQKYNILSFMLLYLLTVKGTSEFELIAHI